MIRTMRLAAAFACAAGLAAPGAALAETPAGSAAPPAASAQPASPTAATTHSSPTALAAPKWAPPKAPTIKPAKPDAGGRTYAVHPPPDTPTGIYLPAVVLGYAKSTAGCVVVGCEDGPQVGGAAGPAPPAPENPAPSDPR